MNGQHLKHTLDKVPGKLYAKMCALIFLTFLTAYPPPCFSTAAFTGVQYIGHSSSFLPCCPSPHQPSVYNLSPAQLRFTTQCLLVYCPAVSLHIEACTPSTTDDTLSHKIHHLIQAAQKNPHFCMIKQVIQSEKYSLDYHLLNCIHVNHNAATNPYKQIGTRRIGEGTDVFCIKCQGSGQKFSTNRMLLSVMYIGSVLYICLICLQREVQPRGLDLGLMATQRVTHPRSCSKSAV